MKNKILVLVLSGVLAVGIISVVYAQGRNNTSSDNSSSPMMSAQNIGSQLKDSFNNMIKIMQDNGFSDEAKAMQNRDYDAMNKFMNNLNDTDYKKMIDIMQSNGYGSMANMMKSVDKGNMTQMHQDMMGR
ncbi:hypothetical protein CPAST_c25490 [Clostridium pasteurianum DSM 525 = ATCC 6013]|uniref:Uncharacterized protein n=1 Tax=Clostridium pasteurianum DSM 525 = ATCC 6013 TaxID=1262449 RepID=A0A0H3J9B7_CLOPA|nr:hypothetical protein [Clostridium pasteurianum]AJA48618.1 hypothetical protein CPAST_c25490 [Clostridium pasteurianum DSM 525 = ATCC 6013]AJA52606.1 hypothetical protein CLPA_c25490 [Clostridium pasteurianum DSM 525 = ATCC 6013]AOZ75848.1 hypothetical protein AQ983_12385 [Clostridium pasteurianum DSM 525 = ATCC 6013]AOZ79644.1 hypothetical protein AQ984_12380 [Clostridium pasteurianum]ELP57904.1 hypothetical protein F502_16925 [Clostridium pasteurianum DSM 525 = ATCC 6013]